LPAISTWRVGGALAAITAATEDLRQGVSNSLYVHSAPSLASLWLMPRLRRFAEVYPDIALEPVGGAHAQRFRARGRRTSTSATACRSGPTWWWSRCSRNASFPWPVLPSSASTALKRVEQLLDVPLIQSNVSVVQWSDWFKPITDKRAPERFAVRFDRAQMSLDAATQGLGVALESATIAAGHLRKGKLRQSSESTKLSRSRRTFAVYPLMPLTSAAVPGVDVSDLPDGGFVASVDNRWPFAVLVVG
jgi:DNA-binding transcriptional LysR family regulator